MLKFKKILALTLVGVLSLGIMTGCKKNKIDADDAKKPISEQKIMAILDKQSDGPITEEELGALRSIDKFSHFSEKDLSYANTLKQSYGKNLLFQTVKNAEGKEIPLGSLVKNREKPTVFAITRAGCPFCVEMLKTFEDYNENDFNIIFAQGHVSENMDIKEDLLALNEEAKGLGDKVGNLLLENSVYDTDSLMDDLFSEYYPTLIYLNNQGDIVNVSPGTDPDTINKIFAQTLTVEEEK